MDECRWRNCRFSPYFAAALPIACAIAAPSAAVSAMPTPREIGCRHCVQLAPNASCRWPPVRRVQVEQFVTGAFEVTLQQGELLQAIRIRVLPVSPAAAITRSAARPICMGAAVLLDRERDRFRAVIGATQAAPFVVASRARFSTGSRGRIRCPPR